MQYRLIKSTRLYDGLTDEIQTNVEVLTEDDRIKEVGRGIVAPAGTETIDLGDVTLTPGLIDAHVHLGIGHWQNRRHETIYENPVYKGLAVLANARRAMTRGFTTLRVIGNNCDDGYGAIVAKRMINNGYMEGSRLVVAPWYTGSTRSHADSSALISHNPKVCDFIWEQYPGYVSGAASVRENIRKQAKYGADFIKLYANGGFSTPDDGPEDDCLTDEEMKAAIDTAHQLGLKITSHSYAPSTIRRQVEMGIDGIEHGALLDDMDLLKLMIEKGTELTPTFCPYDPIVHMDEAGLKKWPYEMQLKLIRYGEWLTRARKAIVDSGIAFGYGTDFVAQHSPYECGYEYETMLNSSVDPFRALAAATRVNKKTLQMENDIGAIAPGYFADLAAWRRDLLTDPKALLDCAFVMKGGTVYEAETVE